MMKASSIQGLTLAAIAVCAVSTAASADTFNFDSAVTTGSSQAAGVWYTDRYAPAGFSSPVFFDGDNRLKQSISAADGASSRPGAFSGSFYNTQGRKYDLADGTKSLSIDIYIPADWASTGRRMAGLWGTAFDAGNAVSAYPIVEFASDAATPRFQAWNGSGWMSMGLPTGFAYDAWYTLEIEMGGGGFNYSVGDLSAFMASANSVDIANVILQGHNTTDGVSYDIHWDNLVTTIPLPPAAWAGLSTLAGVGFVGFIRRRRMQA